MTPSSVESSGLPRVVIVGRPNAGKSTLLNRVTGRRLSIVHERPGSTRDRVFAEANWRGRDFLVVDTAGYETPDRPGGGSHPGANLWKQVTAQIKRGIAEADVLLFLVDARVGVTPEDQSIGNLVRRANKPVIVVANKVDSFKGSPVPPDLHELGFETIVPISALHGRNVGDLLDAVVERLADSGLASPGAGAPRCSVSTDDESTPTDGAVPGGARKARDREESDREALPTGHRERSGGSGALSPSPIRIAILGQPNAGKSSLVNALLGEERVVVDSVPGTTRDAIDTPCVIDGTPAVLIDTAGVRRRFARGEIVERASVGRAREAIDRADVGILLVDGDAGLTVQDRHIASLLEESGKGTVIGVNKIDLIPAGVRKPLLTRVRATLEFVDYAPIFGVSALKGRGVLDLVRGALAVVSEATALPVTTGAVNALVADAIAFRPPKNVGGKPFKIYYGTFLKRTPPTFMFFANDPKLFTWSYSRYLENRLRSAFPFPGYPLRLVCKARSRRGTGSHD